MFGLPKSGRGVGFHRLADFFDLAKIDPQDFRARSLVITGSNGKGSTSRMASDILRAHHRSVGLFTSPHLLDVTERIEVSGAKIPRHDFDRIMADVLAFNLELQARGDSLGAFEALFLVAVKWFYEAQVECAVWEAGIGGRYDPVRFVAGSHAVLTSLDLEHTELLGGTLELIAFDKLDISLPFGVTFVAPSVPDHLRDRLRSYAALTSKTVYFVADAAQASDVRINETGTVFRARLPGASSPQKVRLSLLGEHQVSNSLAAVYSSHHFITSSGSSFDVLGSMNALTAVRWPGRFERISQQPEVWIDAGHTPEGILAAALTATGLLGDRRPVVVTGMSENKSIEAMVAILEEHFDTFVVTQAYKNGAPAARIAGLFSDPSRVHAVCESIEDSYRVARQLSESKQRPILVLGGLFLAVEFAEVVRGNDPAALDFFG
jgi:dihydrofolate synthase/folylpolyglutamate synthase